MLATQKLALQKYHPKLLHDLDLNADLVGKFIHHGIFNEDKIEEFKSKPTRRAQVQEMLLQLPTRGPRAFELFIHSLQDNYKWLADGLREKYHKLTQEKDPQLVSVKEKVDMFVHEHFGSSKRLCEEDKKSIRIFVYKFLKQYTACTHEGGEKLDNSPNLNSSLRARRESIDSTSVQDLEQAIQNKLLRQVFVLLNKGSLDNESDFPEFGEDTDEVTLETIENKVNELNNMIEGYEQEIKKCYSSLGLENCKYPLSDVLETYKEKNEEDTMKFKEKIERLERKRVKLEEKLLNKDKELKEIIKSLGATENENKRSKALVEKLTAECARLEAVHEKHMEKQNTLIHLKNMVNDLSPLRRQRQSTSQFPFDEVDGHLEHSSVVPLPPLASQSGVGVSQSQHGRRAHRQTSTHYEVPGLRRKGKSGKPWK